MVTDEQSKTRASLHNYRIWLNARNFKSEDSLEYVVNYFYSQSVASWVRQGGVLRQHEYKMLIFKSNATHIIRYTVYVCNVLMFLS